MVDTARAARSNGDRSLRHDAMLDAVTYAAERLLLSTDPMEAVDDVMARVGNAAAASRAYVIENTTDGRGRPCVQQIAEWCAAGVSTQQENPDLSGAPWVESGFGGWMDPLRRGEAIAGSVEAFPEPVRTKLAAQDVRSLIVVPIHVENDWWGVVGFDDCFAERDWLPSEVNALKATATVIGAAMARRLTEQRRAEADARYRSVVEGIPAASYIDEPIDESSGDRANEGARVTFVSPQMEEIIGYPPERFVDEPGFWFELMHPDDYQRLEASGALDAQSDEDFDEEYRMRHADGRWVWVHDTTRPIRREDGSVDYWQGFMMDISARKQAEAKLQATEQRYREFLERIPAVTYTDLPQADAVRMGYVSPQIAAVLGYPAQMVLDDERLWGRLIHPDDYARMKAENAFDPEDASPFDQEYRMRTADGRWVWVHDTSTAVLDEEGSIDYFQGFMLDVTERKEAEERLRKAEQRFRVIVEQMPAAIYTEVVEPGTTRAASMEYLSPRAETLFGYPVQAWLEDVSFWESIVHEEDRAAAVEAMDHVNATGSPLSLDYRIVASDGHLVWVHEEAVLVHDEDGQPAHWQGFLLDITERKEAEQRLLLAEERYRTIVEHTPAVTYQEPATGETYDPSTIFTYVSPQIEAILGYPASLWSSTPGFWMQVAHPEDLGRVMEESREASISGEPYRQEYRLIAADGRVVWFQDESHLIRDEGGAPLFWQGVMVDITERMEAEERLNVAQERLQALIDHMPAAVYTQSLDADPAKFYVSPQVERMFGYTPEEWRWTADFWISHIHPDDAARVDAEDRRTDETLEPSEMEYRFRKADGTYAWVHDEAVFVETGKSEGFWQGFIFDITGRKEAEEQIAAAERRYRATVEHLPAVVYREAPGPRYEPGSLFVSPQSRELLGYTPEEWVTTPNFWFEHIHPEDRERVERANTKADATRDTYAADYRMRRRDGSYVWVHDEATFVVSETGEGFWQGFILDVTQRTEAERAMREAEEKYRSIVENNPAVIYTQEFDPGDPSASRTTYVSPRQAELLGYTEDEVLSDSTLWMRLVHPEDRDRVKAADVESNVDEADRFSQEYRMIAKDGRIVWVRDDAQLVRVEGRPPFWQGFLLDITERKAAEEQLERALDVEREATSRLRALDEMKNTFLQAVSHDLRTPLAAILGLAITLERGDVHLNAEESKDLARRIAGNARRLDRLVTNLLDLDRLARGIVAPKLQPLDVGTLVRRVVAESELIPDSRLRTEIEEVVVQADGAKVERIVENLLANTARHTPEDSTIWVRVTPDPEGVTIVVEDDGAGVAPELRDTIFEPFQQGPDAPQHSPGVGVGLTLVRRFAELHGGRAWVQERDGGGASFRVFLPASPPPGVGDDAGA
jgi:PAS domain S-box-containing protein